MKKLRISAIAAIGRNRELGKDGDLIWRLEADWERMKSLIKGHVLVMGRKTYESIERKLPNQCIVITTKADYQPKFDNALIAPDMATALEQATVVETNSDNQNKEVFIFGGSSVYAKALAQTKRLYLTEIEAEEPEADSFFPEYKNEFTHVLETVDGENDGIKFRLRTLER